jgi:hypothetical protein
MQLIEAAESPLVKRLLTVRAPMTILSEIRAWVSAWQPIRQIVTFCWPIAGGEEDRPDVHRPSSWRERTSPTETIAPQVVDRGRSTNASMRLGVRSEELRGRESSASRCPVGLTGR